MVFWSGKRTFIEFAELHIRFVFKFILFFSLLFSLLRTMDGREVALAKKFIDNQIFNSNQEGSVTMTMTLGTDTLLEESLSE